MERNLVMLCGDQATFVLDLSNKYYAGIKARKVYFFTIDKPNYYNDGHISLEVQNIYKKWIIVDLQRDVMYLHKFKNKYLSAFEIIKFKDAYIIKRLNKNPNIDIRFKRFRFDYTFFEQLSYSEIGYKMFVERIMQTLAITDDKENFFYTIKKNNFDKKKLIYILKMQNF